MGLEKVGTTIIKEIIALKGGLATRPVKIKGLKIAPKLERDIVQIPGKSSCISSNLTNMVDDISNEFRNIDKALIKASSLNDFKNLSAEINCLPNSTERNILMKKFLTRFKVFKAPFNGIKNSFS